VYVLTTCVQTVITVFLLHYIVYMYIHCRSTKGRHICCTCRENLYLAEDGHYMLPKHVGALHNKFYNCASIWYYICVHYTVERKMYIKYSSTLSLTSAVHGVGGQRHAPAALPPRKIRGTHSTGG